MKFSLILPTRGRVQMLSQLCRSIHDNTNNLSQIEVLIAYDWDDINTVRIVPDLANLYPWIRFYGRERGNSISRDYQNWLYRKSCGKYIFVLNDDVELITKNWDEFSFEQLEIGGESDGIVYGWTNDSETMNRFYDTYSNYSCFPILSRAAIDILGYVMHEHFGGWTADVHIFKVYSGVNKITNLSNVVVKHVTPWLGLRNHDDTNWSMQQNSINSDIPDTTEDIKKLSRKIIRKILL